jgi:hypothetical protein
MKVKLINGAAAPKHGRKGDAGYDFFLTEDVVIKPRKQIAVDTGVCVELPAGYAGLFALRSSICNKNKHLILKNPLVDENYRGELHGILYNDSFFLKGYAKEALHIGRDGIGQSQHFGTGATAPVDEHEGLFVVHTATAHIATFPSGMFYEPSGGQLVAFGHGVGHHVGVTGNELVVVLPGDHRVFEETACTACFLGAGQLAPTHG